MERQNERSKYFITELIQGNQNNIFWINFSKKNSAHRFETRDARTQSNKNKT